MAEDCTISRAGKHTVSSGEEVLCQLSDIVFNLSAGFWAHPNRPSAEKEW
jgi:hypothetical protein